MTWHPHEEYLVHQDKQVHIEHHSLDNDFAVSPQNLKCVWDPVGLALKKVERNR